VIDNHESPAAPSGGMFAHWLQAILAASAGRRRRLPRDVVGLIGGAALATSSWLLMANGVGDSTWFKSAVGNSWLIGVPAIGGVIVLIAFSLGVSALAGRWRLMAEMVGAGVVTGLGCVAVGHGLHVGSGYETAPALIGTTTAAALLFARVLRVDFRHIWWIALLLVLAAATIHSDFLALGSAGAFGLGLLIDSLVLVIAGTSDGLPTIGRVHRELEELGLHVDLIDEAGASPVWGSARFIATEQSATVLTVDVYGKDVPEAQFIARLWRFLWVRRSTLDLAVRPAEHIERVVGLIHWVEALGMPSPVLVAAERSNSVGDAVLVIRSPSGRQLDSLPQAEVSARHLEAVWRSLQRLDAAGIALRRILASDIRFVSDDEVCFTEFSYGMAMASRDDRNTDMAMLLIETSRVADPSTAVQACLEVVGPDRLLEFLPLVQPRLLTQSGAPSPASKGELSQLRQTATTELGAEPVEPLPLTRVQPQRIIMLVGTFVGIWLLIQQLSAFGNIREILDDAQWGLALVALLLAQSTALTEALSLSGAAPSPIPLGPLALLRSATDFTGLVGGTIGRTATIVRFYQKRGLSQSVAVSSGVIYSLAGFVVQVILGGIALVFAADEFSFSSDGASGSDENTLLEILLVVVVIGVIAAVVFTIPKVRRLLASRVLPELASAWANVRAVIADPHKLLRIFGGQAITQLLAALSFDVALKAVGGSASIAALVLICTFSSLLGGLAPVPGGVGVMEAAYIAGLTLLGVPETKAIAATLIYRLCTTYLPPIWGWGSLVWLRRREMV
jgi:uncharacterized membrane protein YbhN (UPF0104 family)